MAVALKAFDGVSCNLNEFILRRCSVKEVYKQGSISKFDDTYEKESQFPGPDWR